MASPLSPWPQALVGSTFKITSSVARGILDLAGISGTMAPNNSTEPVGSPKASPRLRNAGLRYRTQDTMGRAEEIWEL